MSRKLDHQKATENHAELPPDIYREIFNSTQEAIFLDDAATGRMLDVNDAMLRMYGYASKAEVLAGNIGDLSAGSSPEKEREAQTLIRRAIEEGPQTFEWRARRKNGEAFWTEVSLRSIRLGGEPRVLAMVRDITERRKELAQIRLSEARLQSLYDIAQHPAGNIQELLDFTLSQAIKLTDSRHGCIHFYDEGTRQFTLNTWSKDMMAACAVANLQTTYELEKTGIWGEAVRQRRPIMINDFDAPNPFKKGYSGGHVPLTRFLTIPVTVEGRIVAVVGAANKEAPYDESDIRQLSLLMDSVWKIVERRRNEDVLRASEQKYRQLFEHLVVGFALHEIIVDERGVPYDYRFLEINPAFERMTGLKSANVVGRTVREVIPGLEPVWIESYGRVALTGQPVRFENFSADLGRHYDVQAYSPRRGQFAVFCVDITERKKDEAERQKLDRQVQQAQKMESLGILAGGIAHDFNNLLTAIMGNINLALIDLPTASPAYAELIDAEKATRRAADLSRQMLAYSGKGRFVVERVDLREIVQEMVLMLQVSISKKASLRFNFAERVPAIMADATQLRQIIMNLVINASEAIGDQEGTVSLSIGDMHCDRAFLDEISLDEMLPEGRYVSLEVADTGCGITRDNLFKIFDPFFTTKFLGRGLGLAAVLGIVRGHKGAIKVLSEPGRGTTFKILFPAVSDPASVSAAAPPIPVWRGSGVVLLADDEECVRIIGRKMLERIGFDVLVAEDGREAVDLFRTHGANIAAVILDLTMPRMDGDQAFGEIRGLRSDVRVVVSSGYNEQDVVERFAGKGLAGFIQKPYTLDKVRQVMEQVFRRPS